MTLRSSVLALRDEDLGRTIANPGLGMALRYRRGSHLAFELSADLTATLGHRETASMPSQDGGDVPVLLSVTPYLVTHGRTQLYAIAGAGLAWHERDVGESLAPSWHMTSAFAAGIGMKTWCPFPGQWLDATIRVLAMPASVPSSSVAHGTMTMPIDQTTPGLAVMFTLGFVLNE